ESFEELSSQHSRVPNAKRGGEIGYVGRGEIPKAFEEEIFRLKPGEISGVIRTDAGFHLFKVEERRPAGILDYGSAAPLIRERLREDALRARLTQLTAEARKEHPPSVLTKRLPFKYSGTFTRSENE
ncbi:MAG TPA: peptidylprolyl isomerase, partial [Thermoanaerobaculia bacterium]|nr:peptidylprolyl isomerase [Thermoanaerobaculia bacterium]